MQYMMMAEVSLPAKWFHPDS